MEAQEEEKQPYENVHHSRKAIFINNFIGGIAWSFGATLGFSILITLLGFLAGKINIIPFFGTFVADIFDFVVKNSSQINK